MEQNQVNGNFTRRSGLVERLKDEDTLFSKVISMDNEEIKDELSQKIIQFPEYVRDRLPTYSLEVINSPVGKNIYDGTLSSLTRVNLYAAMSLERELEHEYLASGYD